jgi:hypothetical protein
MEYFNAFCAFELFCSVSAISRMGIDVSKNDAKVSIKLIAEQDL